MAQSSHCRDRMKRRGARALWMHVRDSLWFVPSLIVVAALGLAAGMIALSGQMDQEILRQWPGIFDAGAESSRAILSAIAGGMITVAGVTFSIIMVAVTQASTQYTPRILRNFMSDRPNQVVLGIFVGIFAYCLVVLHTVRGGDDRAAVPSLAVLVGILLALVGIAVLVYFVHHIASTLQASNIIARIYRETAVALDQLFPARLGDPVPEDHRAGERPGDGDPWHPIGSLTSGYIQLVNEDALLEIAERERIIIRMAHPVGDFVARRQPIAYVRGARALSGRRERDVVNCFAIGEFRTVEQDAAYGVRQLVDIAMKGLSPGVNDTTTAVSCVDYLGALLAQLVDCDLAAPVRATDGVVRLVAQRPGFEGLLRLSLDQIRQHGDGNVAVHTRILESLATIGNAVRDERRRALLLEQVDLLREHAERSIAMPSDRTRFLEIADETEAAIRRGTLPADAEHPISY